MACCYEDFDIDLERYYGYYDDYEHGISDEYCDDCDYGYYESNEDYGSDYRKKYYYNTNKRYQYRSVRRNDKNLVIRAPTPPPVIKRVVVRAPTPKPEIIERIVVRREPQIIINRIKPRPIQRKYNLQNIAYNNDCRTC